MLMNMTIYNKSIHVSIYLSVQSGLKCLCTVSSHTTTTVSHPSMSILEMMVQLLELANLSYISMIEKQLIQSFQLPSHLPTESSHNDLNHTEFLLFRNYKVSFTDYLATILVLVCTIDIINILPYSHYCNRSL